MIWRFSAYMEYLRNGEDSIDLVTTVISNGVLILAGIFTTALPVLTNMRREPSSVHELATGLGRHVTPRASKAGLPRAAEEGHPRHEELAPQTEVQHSPSQPGYPPPQTPPPTKPLPGLPENLPVTPRPSPLVLPFPPPAQTRLSSWPSTSTLHGSGDGLIVECTASSWSSIGLR